MAARPQRVRRAGPHPADREVPGRRGRGRARRAQQVQGVDVLPTVLEAWALPRARAAGDRRPRRCSAWSRAARRSRRRSSEISHRGFVAHGMRTEHGQVRPALQPRRGRAVLRPAQRPEGADEHRRGEAASACACCKAGVEAAMVPNPFRYVLRRAAAARSRSGSRPAAGSRPWRPSASGRRSAPWWAATGARSTWCCSRAEGAPREVAFTVRPMGAPVTLEGLRDGRPLRPADVGIGEGGQHPEALPYRLPDVESETERDRGLRLFGAPAKGRRRCGCGWRCRRAARSASSTRRRASGCARSATWAPASVARLVVFDLDGTLVDSARDIAAAVNAALAALDAGHAAACRSSACVGVRGRRRARPGRARAAAPGARRCGPTGCCRSTSKPIASGCSTPRASIPASREALAELSGSGRHAGGAHQQARRPEPHDPERPGRRHRFARIWARATCPRASPTRRASAR